MGACLGKNNNIIVNDLRKRELNNNINSKKLPALKTKKYIASPSLEKLGIHFQELHKFKNNNPLLHSNNHSNISELTAVKSDYSDLDNHNNSTFQEILELLN